MNNPNDIDLTLKHIARVDEEKQAEAKAKELKMDYINLVGYPIAPDALNIVPRPMAEHFKLVGYLQSGRAIKIATTDPKNPEVAQYLQQLSTETKSEFSLSFCSATSLSYGLSLYDVLVPDAPEEAGVKVTKTTEEFFEKELQTFQDLKEKISQVSTTELLDIIFAGAVKNDASDIHIEPQEKDFRLRYRIDGVLQDVAALPQTAYKQVLSRIKFLAKLKLDITHPQDGRFEVTALDQPMDIRVASLPTSYGEAVVMRLLPKKKAFTQLENLGLSERSLALINEAISKPQGLILNTGPTGSGKTTTLYAILQKLNQPGRKIITLENPIEYHLVGIEQIQIDESKETSFLDALKGSLRQDPDILMIGEIRDTETAKIALQAAMTGHLVLSTLHANNAPSSLARLIDLGIEPYLLAGSINLIISQRLVRTVHEECGGKGCEACHGTGFKGRTAIMEVLVPSKEIEELIYKKAALRDFEETAHKLGMVTMYEDGMAKVASGITTKEEVERVTQE